MAEEKVFLDANGLYMDSFKLARAIWDDGFRPTVRTAAISSFVGSGIRLRGSVLPRSVVQRYSTIPHFRWVPMHPYRRTR